MKWNWNVSDPAAVRCCVASPTAREMTSPSIILRVSLFHGLPSLFCPWLSGWTYSGLPRQRERSHIHRGAGRNTLHSRRIEEEKKKKKEEEEEAFLWAEQARQGRGCFVEAALVWHLSHTACRGLITEHVTTSCTAPFLRWENVKWHLSLWWSPLWEVGQGPDITDRSCFVFFLNAGERPTYRRVHQCPRCWKKKTKQNQIHFNRISPLKRQIISVKGGNLSFGAAGTLCWL